MKSYQRWINAGCADHKLRIVVRIKAVKVTTMVTAETSRRDLHGNDEIMGDCALIAMELICYLTQGLF